MTHFTTVSQLTNSIKDLLSENFTSIALEGEISNFRPASSGHWYFSLKDSESIISAVMFRGRNSRVSFVPKDGMKVQVLGNVTVYNQRGQYQIVCEAMNQAGIGQILAELEERKNRLAAQGLFQPERKKPIPLVPKRIGVVTSPTGAAIRDILNVLSRRAPSSTIIILPTLVQGELAAPEIVRQIDTANTHHMADVLILARGGGSLEDLLPFSAEEVVLAVSRSTIPIVTGVGHETDTCIADLAADFRAPTPSAAAELVSGHHQELRERVRAHSRTIIGEMVNLRKRMILAMKPFAPERLEDTFRAYLQPYLQRIDDATSDMVGGLDSLIQARKIQLTRLRTTLEVSSPKEVLNRGYAIVRNIRDGSIISLAEQAETGMHVSIQFSDASKNAEIQPDQNNNN